MKISVSLTRTQIQRLMQLIPNLYDYCCVHTGDMDTMSQAYALGMRRDSEVRALEQMIFIPDNGKRRTFQLTPVQAAVCADRLEFAWEIASDNGFDDPEQAAKARAYRDGVTRINTALAGILV